MVNRNKMSYETKKKISNSMRKIFSPPEISDKVKLNITITHIIEFLKEVNSIESNINGNIFINSHGEIADEDNGESTSCISILDFQARLDNKQKHS